MRMMVHVVDATGNGNGHKLIVIRTADTDVVVLAVAGLVNVNLEELWVSYGTRKSHKVLLTHLLLRLLVHLNQGTPFVPCFNRMRHNILLQWTREENSLDNMRELSICYVCISGTGMRPLCYLQ